MNGLESFKKCDELFRQHEPWWHMYTPGVRTPSFLLNDDDFRYVMNMMPRFTLRVTGLRIVSFELMNNHLHMVFSGDETAAKDCFFDMRRRLSRHLSAKERKLSDGFLPCFKPVRDLKSLRNTVAYVHRNGYVVCPEFTPFSYPWGTGRFYFNPFPQEHILGELSWGEIELMFQGRNPRYPETYKVLDGYVSPSSYCDIELGMALFRDAHQYFYLVSKNVESYAALAVDLDDGDYLTDQEMYVRVFRLLKDSYNGVPIYDLSRAQLLDVARTLHFDFRSSNGQICRLLNLSPLDVNSLFPSI